MRGLKAAGHVVVEWQGSFRVKETLKLIVGLWGADGGETSQSTQVVINQAMLIYSQEIY
jgi:hypothetical protein